MKKKCFFKFFFLFLFIFSNAYAENYIIQFQAKVKNLKEFNISESEKFRSYEVCSFFNIFCKDVKGDILKLSNAECT